MPDVLIAPHIEAPQPADIEHLPADPVAFLSIESINALRAAQSAYMSERRAEAIASATDVFSVTDAMDAVRNEVAPLYDDLSADYLKQFIAEDDPKFNEYKDFLRSMSVDKMSDIEYVKGEKRADGTYDEDKAGWKLAYEYRKKELGDSEPLPAPLSTETARLHAEANIALNNSRAQLAKLQTGFRHKFGHNGRQRKAEIANAKASYEQALINSNIAGFALIREQNPGITQEEINYLAQLAYADEFHNMLNEQKKPEYIDSKYGKTVRKLGAMSLPKKVALSVISVGAGIAAGVVGGAAIGISAVGLLGYRVGKTVVMGPIGHNTQSGTERIQKKVTRKHDDRARESIGNADRGLSDERYAQAIGSHVLDSANRIDRSDRNRRIASALTTMLVLVPGVIGTVHKIQKAHEVKGVIKDTIGNRNHTPSSTTSVPVSPVEASAPTSIPVETTSIPVVLAPTEIISAGPNLASSADLVNLDRLINAHGSYPWSRAVEFFNGDQKGATEWIKTAAAKAGATWHNAGTSHAWLEAVDPQTGRLTSDVDGVWRALTTAMLTPPSA